MLMMYYYCLSPERCQRPGAKRGSQTRWYLIMWPHRTWRHFLHDNMKWGRTGGSFFDAPLLLCFVSGSRRSLFICKTSLQTADDHYDDRGHAGRDASDKVDNEGPGDSRVGSVTGVQFSQENCISNKTSQAWKMQDFVDFFCLFLFVYSLILLVSLFELLYILFMLLSLKMCQWSAISPNFGM